MPTRYGTASSNLLLGKKMKKHKSSVIKYTTKQTEEMLQDILWLRTRVHEKAPMPPGAAMHHAGHDV